MTGAGERVTASYRGPTDSTGARIVVSWRGRRRVLPFNYAATDTFAWAASEVTDIDESRLGRQYDDRFDSPDHHVYLIDPEQDGGA